MAHSYTSSLHHIVFSTKGRANLIHDDLQPRLWAYMGGIAGKNKMQALEIGGVNDHAHLLLAIPSTVTTAKAIQLIKGGSSKWINDLSPDRRDFDWQEGYGSFSIGVSQVEATRRYIRNQRVHHRRISFKEEFLAFLKKHEVEFDPRYVWG